MEASTGARRQTWLRLFVSVALGGGGILLALRGIELSGLTRVALEADPLYLSLGVPLLFASYLVRGVRWHYLFPDRVRAAGLRHVFGALMIGFLGNNFLPARGGELVRVVLMARQNQLPASGTLATLVVERVFDGVALGALGVLSLRAIAGQEQAWMSWLTVGFGTLFVALLLLAVFQREFGAWLERSSRRFPGHLSQALVRSLSSALGYAATLSSPVALARALALTLLVWGLEGTVYVMIGRAFGAELDLAITGIVLSAANFASLAPTPGGLGAVELAGTAALVGCGLEEGVSFLVVTAHHGIQYALCLVLGLWFSGRVGFSFRSKVVTPFLKLCDFERLVDAEAMPVSVRISRQLRARGPRPRVSVVVPAFNEERRILPTLLSMLDYFQEQQVSHEIVVVDDGSRDATADIVRQLRRRFPQVQLVCLPSNLGKGAAVRAGMRSAGGELLLFADADGATPISEFPRMLGALDDKTDVAIGSRALHAANTRVARTLKRAVIGRIFAFIVNVWVVPGIGDTQCGFKLFRRRAAWHLFALQQLDGFAFDVELLKLAKVLGYGTAEVPINWADQPGSKVNVVSDSFRMLWDVLRIPFLGSVQRAAQVEPAFAGHQGLESAEEPSRPASAAAADDG